MELNCEEILYKISKEKDIGKWGDLSFIASLEKLINSYNEIDNLKSKKGDDEFIETIENLLFQRWRIEVDIKSNPEINDVNIKKPLFVTGLARTGTTLLHNLLSKNSNFRPLLYWELLFPYPRTGNSKNIESYKIQLAEMNIQKTNLHRNIHDIQAESPEECRHLKYLTLHSFLFYPVWNVTSYIEWLIEQDFKNSYIYYKKLLRYITYQNTKGSLLLKCPSHLMHLETIFDIFPDANVIWLHRDLNQVIPSSLSSIMKSINHNYINKNHVIENILNFRNEILHSAMKCSSKNVMHVSYKELLNNPLDTLYTIMSNFNYSWSSSFESEVNTWLLNNKQHKNGKHIYSLSDYNLTEKILEEKYSDYYQRFSDLF